ncbi:CocE/NonD family hydrolase [Rubrivirga marina]|uniref:X-Pro dipeptidyl-peptidase n=1 Tax=Rubrivirga marina TaxID=1196024 RepID=A0A271J0G0_9BACT|nr:CocE/NonD family hydrolase [Rubrivirga marina]PAP76445.1 X-Pro dipeptidyl-peptidase [Rubrivirga marina]
MLPVRRLALFVLALALMPAADAQADWVRQHYTKMERMVPMRDGVRLFTSIYVPKAPGTYPILFQRTPYGVGPYGDDEVRSSLGPSESLMRDGYVFVYQDVRGKMMSEGDFVAVRPHIPAKTAGQIDESTDTYDTVEWLLEHVPTNGRVGVWGISAPGFYATHALIDAHPAVVAVSPQAPVTDWYLGDDRRHNGAFQLQATFSFVSSYGAPRPEPTTERAPSFRDYGTPDGYDWYLDLGPLSTVNDRFFDGQNDLWQEILTHDTYDAYWQARTPLPHLRDVRPAVLVTGGWFDAQDLYGPLKTFDAVEQNRRQAGAANDTPTYLAMGPWWHGGWARSDGDRYGDLWFGQRTSVWYRENVEAPFFEAYLKGDGEPDLPEASIFVTGANRWRFFDAWPPREARAASLYLQPGGGLGFDAPTQQGLFAEYVSDPFKPVPHTPKIVVTRDDRYVVQDQRFASTRPDVLVFESPVLEEDVTLAGDLFATLFVSTTGTDADFVVKLIDVYPGDAECRLPDGDCEVPMGGFQQLVRGEVMRGKFRNSFSDPEPFEPGEVTEVTFDMEDVAHTFQRGHRMMVQVQSTWFPMVDRNPQRFMPIAEATEDDFQVATHRVFVSPEHPSHLSVRVLD